MSKPPPAHDTSCYACPVCNGTVAAGYAHTCPGPLPDADLTHDEHVVLLAVCNHWISENYGPSIREIMVASNNTGVSTTKNIIDNLVSDGYLDVEEGIARSIRPANMNIIINQPVIPHIQETP